MKLQHPALAAVAAIALAACGGSSSGSSGRTISYSGKTALVSVSDANVTSLASSATGVSSFSSTGGATAIAAVRAEPGLQVDRALAFVQDAARAAAVSPAGVVQSASLQCAGGGTLSLSESVANPGTSTTPAVYQAGDWLQVTAASCKDSTGAIVNGTLRVDITATDGVMPSTSTPGAMTSGFTYGMRLTASSFSTSQPDGSWSGMSGDMAFQVKWDAATFTLTQTVSGTSITSEAGALATVTQSSMLAGVGGVGGYAFQGADTFTDATAAVLASSAFGATVRMCSLEIDGCVDLTVAPPLHQLAADAHPSSGELRLTGKNGAFIDVLAVDATNVTLTWDVDGPGPTPQVTVNTTWACLDSKCTLP